MLVYRICLEKWAYSLKASGNAARWNSKGKFVIYTSASRALACLENIVHRSGEGNNQLFRTMIIDIPDNIEISVINESDLPINWKNNGNLGLSQRIGDTWIESQKTCILRVPSAIIPNEYNYVINQMHADFEKIKLKTTEAFLFDSRIV